MEDTIVVQMTRARAKELGLLMCATCGWPENNHFHWGTKPSARVAECKAYQETTIKGVQLKQV